MTKNSLPSTTVDTDNSRFSVMESLLHEKLHLTWVALFIAAISLLTMTACKPASHTNTLSNAFSSQENSSSSQPVSQTFEGTLSQGTFTSLAQVEPAQQPERISIGEAEKLNPKRTITVAGFIDSQMYARANELFALAQDNNKPIDIVISSPGGSISQGLTFIKAMEDVKRKGVTIRCFVPTLAASMAFTIFTQCSERYALPFARLLFHSPRVGGSGHFTITAQGARDLADGLTQAEVHLLKMIMPVLGVTQDKGFEWFKENYMVERLFLAADLLHESPTAWFQVIGGVEGHKGEWPAPFPGKNSPEDKATTIRDPSVENGE